VVTRGKPRKMKHLPLRPPRCTY